MTLKYINRVVTDTGKIASYIWVGWLVGCFGFNGPLRQYSSLYQAVSKRERERKRRKKIEESKNVQTTPTRTYCKDRRPFAYCHPNCRTPRIWKSTQDHRATRPPPLQMRNTAKLLSLPNRPFPHDSNIVYANV